MSLLPTLVFLENGGKLESFAFSSFGTTNHTEYSHEKIHL